jgi:hypothetical protein
VVTVIVTEFEAYDRSIRVIGEAAKPAMLAYRQNRRCST